MIVLDGLQVDEEGQILDLNGTIVGALNNGNSQLVGVNLNEKALILDEDGNILGKARLVAKESIEKLEKAAGQAFQALPPISTLEGPKCNKFGKIVNEDGIPVGELIEGDPKKLSKAGVQLDDQGRFWDNKETSSGSGKALPLGKEEQEEEEDDYSDDEGGESGPFGDIEDPFATEEGRVSDANGQKVGQGVEGGLLKLLGRAVDADGGILDKRGNLLGRAEPWEEPEPETVDLSELEGLTPNKVGNVMSLDRVPIRRASEGDPEAVAGRKVDAEGQIWGDDGKLIGKVTLIPEDERQALTPFGDFGDLVVRKDGFVEDEEGDITSGQDHRRRPSEVARPSR